MTISCLRRIRPTTDASVLEPFDAVNQLQYVVNRLCNNEVKHYENLWLQCPAFDTEHSRLGLRETMDKLSHFPARAQVLAGIQKQQWLGKTNVAARVPEMVAGTV